MAQTALTTAQSAYPASNPAGFVTSGGAAAAAPVQSVAGRSGAITLSHSDIAGLGGAAVLNVGTTTGTVADGGVSQAAMTTALAAVPAAGGNADAVVAGALAMAMQRPLKGRFAEIATITDYASHCGTLPAPIGGSAVDWRPAFQAAIADLLAKGGGRIHTPNLNPSGAPTIYNIGAPITATLDGTSNTRGDNLHFHFERGATIQQTQYVYAGQVITPAMSFPGAVNPATSANVTVGGTIVSFTGSMSGGTP